MHLAFNKALLYTLLSISLHSLLFAFLFKGISKETEPVRHKIQLKAHTFNIRRKEYTQKNSSEVIRPTPIKAKGKIGKKITQKKLTNELELKKTKPTKKAVQFKKRKIDKKVIIQKKKTAVVETQKNKEQETITKPIKKTVRKTSSTLTSQNQNDLPFPNKTVEKQQNSTSFKQSKTNSQNTSPPTHLLALPLKPINLPEDYQFQGFFPRSYILKVLYSKKMNQLHLQSFKKKAGNIDLIDKLITTKIQKQLQKLPTSYIKILENYLSQQKEKQLILSVRLSFYESSDGNILTNLK